jgi:arylsulfatase A-like enzyme
LVELVDLYPTVCDLVGLELPTHLEGTSLLPLMKEPSRSWKSAAFSRYGDAVSMRTGRFRYTRYEQRDYQGDRNHLPSQGSCELFDHEADPGENRNVAADPDYADHLRALEAQFEAGWTEAVTPTLT